MLPKEDKKRKKKGISILTFIIKSTKLDFQLKLMVYQKQLELSFFKNVSKTQCSFSLLYRTCTCHQGHFHLDKSILSVPYRLAGGLLVCSLSVCPSVSLSVRPSVRHTSVFWTFLCRLLRYWLEIWYMNLSWHNTDQDRVLSRLTYFYRSYCPLLKFSFPDFYLPSFEILTWNLVYEFVMT